MNRFHEAAREGHLDLLRDATRRDANKADDTGRTPTVWAAYEGNTDALRLLVSRGGNPDVCDIQGHTALHYATLSGHVNTVTFLVSFGCNVWALTNDYRTAKDLAAENNHRACLALLDEVAAEQSARSPKEVKKLKEKALVEADKRVKKLRKMQAEHTRWAKKEEKKEMAKQGGLYKKKAGGRSEGSSPVTGRAQTRGNSAGALFSEIISANGTANKRGRSKSSLTPGTSKQAEDSRSRSTTDTRSTLSGRGDDDDSSDEDKDRRPDIREQSFWQPVPGSMIQSLPPRKPGDDHDALGDDLLNHVDIEHHYGQSSDGDRTVPQIRVSEPAEDRRQSATDPNFNDLDWNPDDLDDDDEHQGAWAGTSDLEFFLATHNLLDHLPKFTGEEIDLAALMLLSDDDLIKLDLPLGPRRKLTDAISRRRHAMSEPGAMTDTHL